MRRGKLGFWLRLTEVILRPLMSILTKRDWRGQHNIPENGPAILVANHISEVDPIIIAHFVLDSPRTPRFLAKSTLFTVPVVGRVLRQTGQIPVFRGSSNAAQVLEPAAAALAQGKALIIYPEGTTTSDPELWPMRGKNGVARLALNTGAPVIPIVQWGAHRFRHPQTKKWRIRPRTRVVVHAGPAIDLSEYMGKPFTGELLKEVTEVIMLRLRADLAAVRGEPEPVGQLATARPKSVERSSAKHGQTS